MIKRKRGMWEGGGGRCGCIRFPPLGVDVVLDFSLGCWLTVCVCARACVWAWECTEEERNFSFNFPQLQILHPRALCFYWNRDQKTPSVYDALKHGWELECGIVNLYIWLCLSKSRINSFIEDFVCFTKTDDCNAPWNHVYHLDVEDRG